MRRIETKVMFVFKENGNAQKSSQIQNWKGQGGEPKKGKYWRRHIKHIHTIHTYITYVREEAEADAESHSGSEISIHRWAVSISTSLNQTHSFGWLQQIVLTGSEWEGLKNIRYRKRCETKQSKQGMLW